MSARPCSPPPRRGGAARSPRRGLVRRWSSRLVALRLVWLVGLFFGRRHLTGDGTPGEPSLDARGKLDRHHVAGEGHDLVAELQRGLQLLLRPQTVALRTHDQEVEERDEQREEDKLRSTSIHSSRTSEKPGRIDLRPASHRGLGLVDRATGAPQPKGCDAGAILGMEPSPVNWPSFLLRHLSWGFRAAGRLVPRRPRHSGPPRPRFPGRQPPRACTAVPA